jgi:hypothetical protein
MRPAESEFLAGGWTDMVKLIIAFRSFANAPKNCNSSRYFDYVRTFKYNDTEHSNCDARKEILLKVVLSYNFRFQFRLLEQMSLQPSALRQKQTFCIVHLAPLEVTAPET